ncbi:MAG: hypothetical protein KGL35_08140 [Bradyrhizobium sp.]|uniref:hypothetical protein n=1 Tax=Bradyrhizobium sp. TaxID=376 RepID=UPI0023980E5A|nr:hypothetical protein [Bradyrhizobium sp.]MDE2468698.1 hypothetical protein [Bradyrhizobium sp.]
MRDWAKAFRLRRIYSREHPQAFGERADLRQALGYRLDECICIVTVGGSGVGTHLIRRSCMRTEAAIGQPLPLFGARDPVRATFHTSLRFVRPREWLASARRQDASLARVELTRTGLRAVRGFPFEQVFGYSKGR